MTHDSIYYFKGIGEFKLLIQTIDDRNQTVAEALSAYRETKCLGNRFKQMTVQQLVDEPNLIRDLAEALRNGMEPQSQFKLPYMIAERQKELIEDLAMNYSIDIQRAVAKIVTGHYKNQDTKQEFNYCLEVAMAPRTDVGNEAAGMVEIIGNINSGLSISYGEAYFDSSKNVYQWYDKKSGFKSASSLRGILSEYGFSTAVYMSKRRFPSVLYINLNVPCPDWLGGAGKTHIDLRPYAKDIAETVKLLATKMPTYYGKGFAQTSYGRGGNQQYPAIQYLRDFIWDRYDAIYGNAKKGIQGDPTLKFRDPLTQSGVWYRLRPIMIDGGYEPEQNWGETRRYITSKIDEVCKELGLEREDLGIYAKARGMMLYDGNVYPVDAQSFEGLGKKGVFMLVIEKEGIADVVKEAARGSGVALVHTGGKFTKDVRNLIENAQVPVATLTDYDYDGMKMAEETISPVPRIGIDKDIVEWLQQNGYPEIKLESVEEEYTPRIMPEDEYLREKRIELDSIIAAFPDTPGRGPEALWKYIKYKLEELQKEKGFDYTNVITRPEPKEFYPEPVKTFLSKLDGYVEKVTKEDWEFENNKLVGMKELQQIEEREDQNLAVLEKALDDDEVMQDEIIPRINTMVDELEEWFDDED